MRNRKWDQIQYIYEENERDLVVMTTIRKNGRVVWEKYVGRRAPYDWREITLDLLSWEKYVERRTPYEKRKTHTAWVQNGSK